MKEMQDDWVDSNVGRRGGQGLWRDLAGDFKAQEGPVVTVSLNYHK